MASLSYLASANGTDLPFPPPSEISDGRAASSVEHRCFVA